jgi:chromosomal replication initiation ATPase DnaA
VAAEAASCSTPRGAVRAIVGAEAAKAGIAVADVFGRSRVRKAVAVRHVSIRRVRAAFPLTTSRQLARFFGLHHTSVLYALGALSRRRGAPA